MERERGTVLDGGSRVTETPFTDADAAAGR
jgi:hypothetical protein